MTLVFKNAFGDAEYSIFDTINPRSIDLWQVCVQAIPVFALVVRNVEAAANGSHDHVLTIEKKTMPQHEIVAVFLR